MFWMAAAFGQTATVISSETTMVYIASTTEAAASKRFASDPKNTGPVFDPAEAVRVLIRENGMVRVRSGENYGWLPASAVVAENPKPKTLSFPAGLQIPGAGN